MRILCRHLFAIALVLSLPCFVAYPQTAYPAARATSPADLLDINTASSAQLRALPGMGAAYAARIIAGRPYTAKNQLSQRGVIPDAAYLRIKDLIVAHRVK